MRLLHNAQLLVSCLSLAGQEELPTSDGLFDRALKIALDKGAFPEWTRDSIHFTDSRIGLRCVELPAILDMAQKADLTTAPNPSYHRTRVHLNDRAARRLLRNLDVQEEKAREWGQVLGKALNQAETELASFG